MTTDSLKNTLRDVLQEEPRVTSAYFAVEDSSQGKILTLALSSVDRQKDIDLITRMRDKLESLWNGLVDIVLLTETTPPLYEYIIRESFCPMAGDSPPEARTGFTEIACRRARMNSLITKTV